MTRTIADPAPAASPLGTFERFLSLWVLGAILAGLALGVVAPGAVGVMADLEYASVNLVVAVLIWAMIFPMMVGVDFSSIKDVGRKPKGLLITLVVNWLVQPLPMAADRTSVDEGKRVSVRVGVGGRRIIKKKKKN